jgi:hypothetical protein
VRALARASELLLELVRRWWRPLVCLGIGGSLIVNGIAVPLITRSFPDLTGLAAVIAAASPFAWFRTYEKTRGGEARGGGPDGESGPP